LRSWCSHPRWRALTTWPESSDSTEKEAPELSVEELGQLSLEQLLEVQVVTASKQSESLSSAAAIVSVITADEIATWGARSVAEALMYVPGLYPVYDFVSYNVGVRGINGGLGAYGRIVKVMIDGQPVSFRSNAANYLGPEFIAMEAIERIEWCAGRPRRCTAPMRSSASSTSSPGSLRRASRGSSRCAAA
jgi:iron complex outermembrane receptor protein